MKRKSISIFAALMYFFVLHPDPILFCQEILEVEGAIKLSDASDTNPHPGTIRWTGKDFEGWNGFFWVSLTTNTLGEVSDKSGNTYKTVTIGDTEWMIENLKTTLYNDSTSIIEVTDSATWGIVGAGAYCWYKNDKNAYSQSYGALYNWLAVETDKLCPVGWHIPNDDILGSNSDFVELVNIYGMFTTAPALKSTGNLDDGTGLWLAPNNSTNESGFTAHPGGRRLENGKFVSLGSMGTFWTTEEDMPDNAYRRELNRTNDAIIRFSSDKNQGISVRCVKH